VIAASVAELLGTHGYWVVFAVVGLESMGLPLPGETTLITAALFAQRTGRLDIVGLVAAASAGAILGDNLGYYIGREGGWRALRWLSKRIRINQRSLKLARYLFMKHGGKVVFFGRFVAVLRVFAAFLAGVSLMPWDRFLVFNAAGGIVWAALYGFGTFALGDAFSRLAGPAAWALGVVTAAVIILVFIRVRRDRRRLEEEAERALPGDLFAQAGLVETPISDAKKN
jgi:membrane protein DedA with SNARE-associated domain